MALPDSLNDQMLKLLRNDLFIEIFEKYIFLILLQLISPVEGFIGRNKELQDLNAVYSKKERKHASCSDAGVSANPNFL
jgi:hypothetical protein